MNNCLHLTFSPKLMEKTNAMEDKQHIICVALRDWVDALGNLEPMEKHVKGALNVIGGSQTSRSTHRFSRSNTFWVALLV